MIFLNLNYVTSRFSHFPPVLTKRCLLHLRSFCRSFSILVYLVVRYLWKHAEIELRACLVQNGANFSFFPGKYTITHGKLVQGKSSWLFRAAWGYRKVLNWVKNLDTKIIKHAVKNAHNSHGYIMSYNEISYIHTQSHTHYIHNSLSLCRKRM